MLLGVNMIAERISPKCIRHCLPHLMVSVDLISCNLIYKEIER